MTASPEQMLRKALKVIIERGIENDDRKAHEEPEWELDVKEMRGSPHMESIHYAEMDDYIMYVAVAKDAAVRGLAPGASKRSWSIHTMPENEAITGGSAESVEQGQRFAKIAYQAVYGIIWKGDA